jgi:hypothetical protein
MYPTNANMKTIPIEDLINNRHPNLTIQYTKPLYGLSGEFKLNKEEWLLMITKHLQVLNETPSGNILLQSLLQSPRKLKIVNNLYDKVYMRTVNTPSCVYIQIPDIAYFHSIFTLNMNTINDAPDYWRSYFNEIWSNSLITARNKSLLEKVIPEKYLVEQFNPYNVVIGHEMIHALRYMYYRQGIGTYEEDHTIMGIGFERKRECYIPVSSQQFIVTENSIRRDFGLPVRVGHGSKHLVNYWVHNNTRGYSKQDFIRIE